MAEWRRKYSLYVNKEIMYAERTNQCPVGRTLDGMTVESSNSSVFIMFFSFTNTWTVSLSAIILNNN